MENIEMTIEGNKMTLVIDLTKELGPSGSGKSMVIASTRGNIKVPGTPASMGLNVYRKL